MVPVLDSEALRRAALAASWRRDRWVGRRRVVLRWLGWALWRYVLPALVLAGLCAVIWLYLVPRFGGHLDLKHASAKEGRLASGHGQWPTLTTTTPPATQANAIDPPPDFASEPVLQDTWPSTPIHLKFEADYALETAGSRPAPRPATASAEKTSVIQPQLKPENWLHSKEP